MLTSFGMGRMIPSIRFKHGFRIVKHTFYEIVIVQIIFLFDENNVVMAFLEASHVTIGSGTRDNFPQRAWAVLSRVQK